VEDAGEEAYLKSLFGSVEARSRACALSFDEVHVKPMLQFGGKRVFGEAVNRPGTMAKTVLTFMITCQFGGPRYCLKLLPVRKLDSAFLLESIRKCCVLVEKCGGQVIATVCDNHRINQAAYRMLSSKDKQWLADSPASPGRPLFLLFDSIHLAKSIRNIIGL
jgi:hypothetical protein